MSDASAGGANAALCGYSCADSGVSMRSKSSRKKNKKQNKKLKLGTGVTSRAAKPHSCADNNPAAPLTAILALMTGFVSPWHKCASAAAPSKWRIGVRTHRLGENKRSPFTGKLHRGTCLGLHTDILISSYASAGTITMVGWLPWMPWRCGRACSHRLDKCIRIIPYHCGWRPSARPRQAVAYVIMDSKYLNSQETLNEGRGHTVHFYSLQQTLLSFEEWLQIQTMFLLH